MKYESKYSSCAETCSQIWDVYEWGDITKAFCPPLVFWVGHAQGTAAGLHVSTDTPQTDKLELLRLNPVVCLTCVQEVGTPWWVHNREQLKRWWNGAQTVCRLSYWWISALGLVCTDAQACAGEDVLCIYLSQLKRLGAFGRWGRLVWVAGDSNRCSRHTQICCGMHVTIRSGRASCERVKSWQKMKRFQVRKQQMLSWIRIRNKDWIQCKAHHLSRTSIKEFWFFLRVFPHSSSLFSSEKKIKKGEG